MGKNLHFGVSDKPIFAHNTETIVFYSHMKKFYLLMASALLMAVALAKDADLVLFFGGTLQLLAGSASDDIRLTGEVTI